MDTLEALTRAMHETLRRYPPLPVMPRIATEPFEFGGYQFPAGSMAVVSPIHTHHMSEWWTDPYRWDPDRFAEARAEQERHTHHWVPSAEAEQCMGACSRRRMCVGLHPCAAGYRGRARRYTARCSRSDREAARVTVRFTPLSQS